MVGDLPPMATKNPSVGLLVFPVSRLNGILPVKARTIPLIATKPLTHRPVWENLHWPTEVADDFPPIRCTCPHRTCLQVPEKVTSRHGPTIIQRKNELIIMPLLCSEDKLRRDADLIEGTAPLACIPTHLPRGSLVEVEQNSKGGTGQTLAQIMHA